MMPLLRRRHLSPFSAFSEGGVAPSLVIDTSTGGVRALGGALGVARSTTALGRNAGGNLYSAPVNTARVENEVVAPTDVILFGDSYTDPSDQDQQSLILQLGDNYSAGRVWSYGVGGYTIYQILAAAQAAPLHRRNARWVIWDGSALGYVTTADYLTAVADLVAEIPHDDWVMLTPLRRDNQTAGENTDVTTINAGLISAYGLVADGGHIIDAQTLITGSSTGNVTAAQTIDGTHLTETAMDLVIPSLLSELAGMNTAPGGRRCLGILNEPAGTNKTTVSNYALSASDISGLTVTTVGTFAGSYTVTRELDSDALERDGLLGVVPTAYVLKIDASAVTTGEVQVRIGGATGNTNAHSCMVFLRGSGTARFGVDATNFTSQRLRSWYDLYRNQNGIPANVNQDFKIRATAGSVVYAILWTMVENNVCPYLPILNAGGDVANRGAEAITLTRSVDLGAGASVVWQGSVRHGGSVNARLFQIDNTTNSNRASMYVSGSNADMRPQVVTGGANVWGPIDINADVTEDGEFQLAARFKDNDSAVSFEGAAVATDTVCTMPSGTSTIRLGADASQPFRCRIRQFRLYSTGLTDATLEAVEVG